MKIVDVGGFNGWQHSGYQHRNTWRTTGCWKSGEWVFVPFGCQGSSLEVWHRCRTLLSRYVCKTRFEKQNPADNPCCTVHMFSSLHISRVGLHDHCVTWIAAFNQGSSSRGEKLPETTSVKKCFGHVSTSYEPHFFSPLPSEATFSGQCQIQPRKCYAPSLRSRYATGLGIGFTEALRCNQEQRTTKDAASDTNIRGRGKTKHSPHRLEASHFVAVENFTLCMGCKHYVHITSAA